MKIIIQRVNFAKIFVNNEFKIATLEEKDDILRKNRGKEILEIDAKKIRNLKIC